jgi:hypothetical protein
MLGFVPQPNLRLLEDVGFRASTQPTITHYRLPIPHYRLPITDYQFPITDYPLPITNSPLPILIVKFDLSQSFI